MLEHLSYRASDSRYEHAEKMYKRCGNSGVLLPRISLGLWKGFGALRPYSECCDILHYAFDNGITHFDLANNYGPPFSKHEVFQAIVVLKPFLSKSHQYAFVNRKVCLAYNDR